MSQTPRIYSMLFSKVYPFYVEKAEKKGRSKKEVDDIIKWLTGYDSKQLSKLKKDQTNFEDFFKKAPKLHPNRSLITGSVCGVKIEEITDPLMKEIRYLDKLVDELAKGKEMEKILRE